MEFAPRPNCLLFVLLSFYSYEKFSSSHFFARFVFISKCVPNKQNEWAALCWKLVRLSFDLCCCWRCMKTVNWWKLTNKRMESRPLLCSLFKIQLGQLFLAFNKETPLSHHQSLFNPFIGFIMTKPVAFNWDIFVWSKVYCSQKLKFS